MNAKAQRVYDSVSQFISVSTMTPERAAYIRAEMAKRGLFTEEQVEEELAKYEPLDMRIFTYDREEAHRNYLNMKKGNRTLSLTDQAQFPNDEQ